MKYRRLTAAHIKLIGAKIDGVKTISCHHHTMVDNLAPAIPAVRDGEHLKSVDA